MLNNSMTALEFFARYSSEEACLEAIEKMRWPKGFVCPNCQHDVGYRLTDRNLFQCAVCRHQTSVTAGTIFHKTRVPLTNWFYILYSVAHDKGGSSAARLSQQLNMHYSTVWHIVQKIKYAMAKRDENILLAGEIELDTMFVGPEARKMGRPSARRDDDCLGKSHPKPVRQFRFGKLQTPVIVMVETLSGRAGNVAMRVVERTTYDDIQEFAMQRAEPGQHFKTDGDHSNYSLRTVGFHTAKVCSGRKSLEWLPIVHRVISLAKRHLMGTYHGVSPMYLQSYLDDFCFRFNRREKILSLATSALRACVFANQISYAELWR